MKKCPYCETEMNDTETTCPNCGQSVEDVKPARKMTPVTDDGKDDKKEKKEKAPKEKKSSKKPKYSKRKKVSYGKSSRKPVLISVCAVVVLAVAGLSIFFVVNNKSTEGTVAVTETAVEGTNQQAADNVESAGQNAAEAVTVKNEADDSDLAVIEYILNDTSTSNDVVNCKEQLEKICDYAQQKDVSAYLSEKIGEPFQNYKNFVIAGVDNLNNPEREEFPALYLQMRMDLDDAIELSERLANAGVQVDYSDLLAKRDTLQTEYKQRLCALFDRKANETKAQNGVISRSVLWGTMERADETGLFSPDDVNDPLNVRYMTALALKTDNDLEELDMAQGVLKLYQALEPTDYSPLLIYLLANNYGDTQAQEWLNYIDSVIGGYSSFDLGQARNYLISYMEMQEKRAMIREYMKSHYTAQ